MVSVHGMDVEYAIAAQGEKAATHAVRLTSHACTKHRNLCSDIWADRAHTGCRRRNWHTLF
jgi:hypothetical protein